MNEYMQNYSIRTVKYGTHFLMSNSLVLLNAFMQYSMCISECVCVCVDYA